MDPLKLQFLRVKNYKNISALQLNADGRDLILSGPNGSGKSALFEAIKICFFGKTAAPKGDLVASGEKKAEIETVIGNRTARYSATLSITDKGQYFKVNELDPTGKHAAIPGTALEFFRGIASPIMFDAKEFFSADDAGPLNLLLSALPGLRMRLGENDSRTKAVKERRSDVLKDINRLKADVERLEVRAGLPEEELDPVNVLAELDEARGHNLKIEERKRELESMHAELRRGEHGVIEAKQRAKNTAELMIKLKDQLDQENTTIVNGQNWCSKQTNNIKLHTAEIDKVVPHPVYEFEQRLADLKKTNEAIRQNTEAKKTAEVLRLKTEEYSAGLQKMRAIDKDRSKIMEDAKIPVPGLVFGDGCLMYPDPTTMMPVRLSALSDGQRWPIVTKLYAALSPALKIMYVDDFTSIDQAGREAMFSAAKAAGLQLLIHETTMHDQDAGMGFFILNGELQETETDGQDGSVKG